MKITRRDPVEFIKYVLLFIKWNPDSPVGNADGYCPPSLSAENRQFGFLFRVLHRIIYQVTDDVAEMRTVAYSWCCSMSGVINSFRLISSGCKRNVLRRSIPMDKICSTSPLSLCNCS